MSSQSRWVILAFSILGLGFASYSAWVHYQLMTNSAYTSPCDISSTFSCSQVYLSQYGSVAGVPVALAGMFWFSLVLLIAAFPESGRGPTAPGGTYIFALSTIGMAVILYLGYSSWIVLKAACLLCIGAYVSVIGIFITSGRAGHMPVTRLPGRLFSDLAASFREPMAVALALILFGATGYAAVKFPPEGTRPQSTAAQPAADFSTAWAQQPRVDLGIPADGAKVIVVKFNDYQCPGCGATHAWYKPVLEKFEKEQPGAVKYIVKDWPWDTQCNVTAGMLHQAGCEAAAAVRMGADRSPAKEKEIAEWIYANQATLTPASLKEAASRILGVTDFDREYGLKLPDIQKDIADGVALRIRSTPTLFINGVRIEDLMPASYFELAIQLELNKAAGK